MSSVYRDTFFLHVKSGNKKTKNYIKTLKFVINYIYAFMFFQIYLQKYEY